VRISVLLRRLVTMVPALVVLALGVNPTDALILSQVVLSFGIPLALIPLVMLTMRRDVMGEHVNKRITTVIGVSLAALITALNLFLIYKQIF
jgi:manganese transport protein